MLPQVVLAGKLPDVIAIRRLASLHRDCMLLAPTSVTVKLIIAYQKIAQLFGPVLIDVVFGNLDVGINDEQLTYFCALGKLVADHVHKLQMRCRSSLIGKILGNATFSPSQVTQT